MVFLVIFELLEILSFCGGSIITRVVRTKYGDITGTIVTPNARFLDAVEVYKGIPYAAPPVGNLRFMPPVSGALWTGVKMADKFAPVCPQNYPDISNETLAIKRMPRGRLEYLKRLLPYLKNQSEDCLYLNIYAPTQDGDELKKYPVLVFIHGESYEWNSGNPYDGTVLASFAGLVVVTINYRLGVLGFLNINTDVHQKSPSNYGLMDQIAALHWLQENVAYFGGDPTNVTLAGHGTGASCVNFLMSSTAVPEGLLFHRAILMSGSSLSPWALVKEPSIYAKQVAQSVNCSFQLPHLQLLKCLRDRPLQALIDVKVQVPEFNTAFGPNVDGVVIDLVMNDIRKIPPDSVHGGNVDSAHDTLKWPFFGHFPLGDYAATMLNNPATKQKLISKYSRYDLMTGIVSAESFFIFTNEDVQYGIEADRRAKILKTFVKNTYRYHLSEILATVVNEYTEWERPIQHPINIRDETLEAISDAQYVAPVTQTADLHSSAHRNSYFYVFEYQSKYGDYQQRQGCIHGEELAYLFGAPLVNGLNHFPQNYTKSEISLAEAFMLYVGNFARTGNPNDPGLNQDLYQRSTLPDRARLKNIEWTPYESVHKKYLSLDTKLKLKNHYRAHKLSFWLNLIPELHKPGSDDVPPSHHQFQPEEIMYPQQSYKVSTNITTTTVNKAIARNESFNSTLDLPVVMVASSSSDRNAMTPNNQENAQDEQLASKENGFSNYSLALIITIAAGCILLTCNILVFIIVYHKKDHTRSNSDKNSGSIRSISSNNSLIMGLEGGPQQSSRKVTENGGPSLNIKNTIEPSERHRIKNEAINTSMVDQSVMFVLEPLKHNADFDGQYQRRGEVSNLSCTSCSTLPKLSSSHTSNKSTEVSPSYWSSKLNDDIRTRSPCELGLGTVPRPPKSILKHQSVNTDGISKCSDDFSRIRV